MCSTSIVAGIEVEVRDAISNAPIAENATGEVVDGAYHDSLRVSGFESGSPDSAYLMSAAYERPGVYSVVVDLEGYKQWTASDVQVAQSVCHVGTVRLTARMESE
jgi:hypothetical protein